MEVRHRRATVRRCPDGYDPVDYADPEAPKIRRLRTFGAALEAEVGDERPPELYSGHFLVWTPTTDYPSRGEGEAREVVRDYVREHGEDAAREDVEVFLQIEATGTSHTIDVSRFLGD